MANLNANYVIAPSLQMYFVTKDSGVPLAGGKVYFYQDGTNIPKNVYELTGTPGNYTYTALPNPITLSSVGTFQDGSGNDILPYYFPWTDSTATTIQLYTIQVYDANGVLQFTRNGWPNTTSTSSGANSDVTTNIQNPQFLVHNNPLFDSVGVAQKVSTTTNSPQVYSAFAYGSPVGTLDTWDIAQGNWTFEKNQSSSSVDTITFPSYSSVTSPTGNPRFAVQIATTTPGSDATKDLCVKFLGVNTFASNTQTYNLYFEANAVASGVSNVLVIVRKFFGTGGGDPTTETTITSFNLTTAVQQFNIPILFGTNTGKSLGTGGDDFVQIVIRMPVTGTQTCVFTNFALTLREEILTSFPNQTAEQQLTTATSGAFPIPTANGSDLYLPVVLTATGLNFDTSVVGQINPGMYSSSYAASMPVFLCDGSTYISSNYTNLGVPQSRLGNVLIANSPVANTPMYGTGSNYATCYAFAGNTSALRVVANSSGTGNAMVDGATSTGFTFKRINTGAASINYTAYNNVANTVFAVGTFAVPNSAVNAGTSGFTVTALNSLTGLLAARNLYSFTVQTVAAASLANPGGAGKYWHFANAGTDFYMWFHFTNETDPAPGGTGIEVIMDGLSAATAQDVANIVREVINRYESDSLVVTAVPTTPGAYFTFFNQGSTKQYNVWFRVNGAGTAPATPSGANILVNLTGGETTAQCATKILTAINAYQYAVPDFRGMFFRGLDTAGTWDTDVAARWSTVSGLSGANLGTFEFQQFLSHYHNASGAFFVNATGGAQPSVGGTYTTTTNTNNTGGNETRPVNAAVNYFIHY